ncbi:histidine kinase [Leifsonia kafniensis]|uniref:histidine kinase n=1 Tax=Leifsonia kafniensis TaxID=475957 RepID=A0ABP7KU28_9MICO
MTEQRSTPVRPSSHGGDLRLPTPPGVIRQFWARHPWWADSIVAGVYLVPMLIALLFEATGAAGAMPTPRAAPQILITLVVVVATGGALLFRRHAPFIVLGVTWLGLLLALPDFGQGDSTLPVSIALYAVAVYRSVRAAWIGLAISAVVGTVGALLHSSTLGEFWLNIGVQYALVMLAVTLVGINIGNRRRYVAAIIDRAAQLARERDQQSQLARISERSRIAREMHDIVAHSLSVIVALADGADAIADKDPARSREAMRQVAATGRGSLVEMRRLLGVLADNPETDAAPGSVAPLGDAGRASADLSAAASSGARVSAADQPSAVQSLPPLEPQPGIGQLADLIESFRSAGLPTRLEMSGQMPANPGIQLTIYRIVQESLTNALRYSLHPTLVTVRVSSLPGRLEVVVSDDGRPRPATPSQGSGRGIVGMRERVALYGGTLDAGRSPGGGWRVRAAMSIDDVSIDDVSIDDVSIDDVSIDEESKK